MPNLDSAYEQLTSHTRETALFQSIESLLGWDERTHMPLAAGEYRADQMTLLAGLLHRRRTDPRLGQWLTELAEQPADSHSDRGATVRELKRQYDRRVKLPQALVEELARTSVLGQQAWFTARANDDFKSFLPLLEKMFQLKREAAEALGYEENRYDALLDDYEPRGRTSQISQVLAGLREQLVPLVAAIGASSRKPNVEIVTRQYALAEQEQFAKHVAAECGFDFQRGRLDVTAHPFCTNNGPHDTRITTRYNEHHFPGAFFGVLHEAGHGIYDQGLRTEWYGLPPGEAVSLGIHESQSRMWENFVGRSKPFWKHFYGEAQRRFSPALGGVSLDNFYAAINDVRPSLIRTESDEATYNLHVLIRFELEQALVADDLKCADLPAAWNEKYHHYLGITPPNDAQGVLQDIHWSAGLVGYFPTYALGNLYAAQFFEQADQDLGGLHRQFERGEFEPLKKWLREHIHRAGQCYTADELVQRITGKPLSHAPLMAYLKGKFGPLYGLK
ncbi:MAG TPA: carboxypeptidase M32 [Pirellulales bacterium]|jgi:carboxypeptidase Taq|nr:carboxypeptidase M32 [Pirellulales bacterium]